MLSAILTYSQPQLSTVDYLSNKKNSRVPEIDRELAAGRSLKGDRRSLTQCVNRHGQKTSVMPVHSLDICRAKSNKFKKNLEYCVRALAQSEWVMLSWDTATYRLQVFLRAIIVVAAIGRCFLPKGSIEISTFEPLTVENAPALEPPPPEHPVREYVKARQYAIEQQIPGAVVGAVLSVLLHALLVTSYAWGVSAHSHHRHWHPIGSSDTSGAQQNDSSSMQWVVVDLGPSLGASSKHTIHVNPKLALVKSAKVTSREMADVAAELDSGFQKVSAAGDSVSAADSAAVGNVLVKLAGRYVGQIDARIDRAWLRPRSAIGAPRFACRVRINQSRAGDVLNVGLERCNGSSKWQRSLIEAVRAASPLPQPPKPTVFAPVVHMSFESVAYHPGAFPGKYAPLKMARATLLIPSAKAGEAAVRKFSEALKHARANQVISITITGKSVSVVRQDATASH